MAGAKRFLSTVVTTDLPAGDGVWQNTCGKPLSVTIGAQAITTSVNSCMTLAVGIGTTVFGSTLGIASGNFANYFGMNGPGANPVGHNTVFGTFYLGADCNCPGGSYCASAPGIASYIAADGTETKNWEGGHNPWGCCLCICAGPYPDTSCSSWCGNAFWGGQEWINPALSFYHEYSGLCWDAVEPYVNWNVGECRSVHALGWTRSGTCHFGGCRQNPPMSWLLHGCHAEDPNQAAQVWINPYCCCGKCNYCNSSISTMAICFQYNNYQCGGYYNWYALTNNMPDIVCKKFCCENSQCNICECNNHRNFQCFTNKCPDWHTAGDIEVYLNWIARGPHKYCVCYCCACGRWCRDRYECCCISQFTDCYSWLCQLCCWQHWSEGWTCHYGDCRMNPYGGVAGAGTHCGVIRHHKTMGDCQMWFIGINYACTYYCQRCSCYMHTLDLWIKPNKYGTTGCCTNEYGVKYMSWNPQKCCTYLAIRSAETKHCGIFSWFASGQQHEYRDWTLGGSNRSVFCIYPCDSTYFTKVADFPAAWVSDEKYYSPIMCTTCIHRIEKCLWAIGVYNCDELRFDPFISTDLINWAASPSGDQISETVICASPQNCIVEYLSTTCKWRQCTSFDGAVCQEGILDWKLSFNNYERTGVIIDCDERLFVNNIQDNTACIGTNFNLQVWWYEG